MLATDRDMIEDRFAGVGVVEPDANASQCGAASLGCLKMVFEEKADAQTAFWKALLYRFWVSVELPKRVLTKQL